MSQKVSEKKNFCGTETNESDYNGVRFVCLLRIHLITVSHCLVELSLIRYFYVRETKDSVTCFVNNVRL